jgi:hypothetical protein
MTRFELHTLVCDSNAVKLSDLEYSFHIDMETSVLKSIVRMPQQLGGEELVFKVQQPIGIKEKMEALRKDNGNNEKTKKILKTSETSDKNTVLTITSNGKCIQEHTFFSVTEARDGSASSYVGTTQNHIAQKFGPGELITKCEQVFAAKNLGDFLKSIDKQTLTLRLSEGKPLIVNHKMGPDDSYVCLVLAPRAQDVS